MSTIEKICSNCGAPLASSVKLCPFCASPVNSSAPKTPSTSSVSSSEDINKLPWAFIGAYAFYSGTAVLRDIGYVEADGRIEVTEIDVSHYRWKAKMSTTSYTKIMGKQQKLSERTKELWYPFGEFACESEKAIKLAEYEGNIRIGTVIKSCVIYEYAEGLNTELIFWDKELKFPLKYLMITRKPQDGLDELSRDIGETLRALWNGNGNPWSVDDFLKAFRHINNSGLRETPLVLNLKETNIPGLVFDNK